MLSWVQLKHLLHILETNDSENGLYQNECLIQIVDFITRDFRSCKYYLTQLHIRISFHYEYASAVMLGLIFLSVTQRDAIKHI